MCYLLLPPCPASLCPPHLLVLLKGKDRSLIRRHHREYSEETENEPEDFYLGYVLIIGLILTFRNESNIFEYKAYSMLVSESNTSHSFERSNI